MNHKLIIGQYVPRNSLIHRLDPRIKLTIIFFFVVFVFFANNVLSYSVMTLFALCSMILTNIPIRFILRGLTPVWFLVIFTFILHLIMTRDGFVLLKIFNLDRKSTRLNSSHVAISYAVFCLKKKKQYTI